MWTSTRTVRATSALTLLATTLALSGCSSDEARPAPSSSAAQPTTATDTPTTPTAESTSTTEAEPSTTATTPPAPSAPTTRRPRLTPTRDVPAPLPTTPEPSETTLVTRTPRPTTTPTEPTGTSTTAAGRTWLADLGSDGEIGPAPIAGQVYRRSISVSACTIYSGQPTYAFRLDGRYRTLRAVVGQDDGSESQKAVVQVTVRGDGRTLASRRAVYGTASPITVDVSGVQRLTVGFREVSCGTDGGAAAVLGAPRVIG